jgi:hypothetical protein
MESLFQDRLAEYYETLAFHIKNSRLWGKAVEYLIKSGQKCLKRYSVTESHQYFSEAFTILNEVSDKTKKGGVIKAKEAYELYLQFRPDGVIAADDNAQSMFVLPYLKDKVETPVMFCAVNEEPEIYGYPASNVSGILERNFIKESIAFAKQLVPSINRIGFLVKDSPSGYGVRKQVEGESDLYLAEIADFKLVKTIEETLVVHKEYDKISDALFISATNGILDAEGKPMDNEQVTRIIAKLYNANFRDYGFEGVIEKPYRIQDMSDVLRSFYGDEKSKG